jgi:hypothetical protein
MTTDLNCRFALANTALQEPADLADVFNFVHEHFLSGSHGEINLNCADAGLVPNPGAQGAVSALQLHYWLLQVNQNALDAPLKNICVLFAHSYAGLSGAYGIMFDRGFTTVDDPNDAQIDLERPRQGCAVFLDTIQASRPVGYRDEVLFTTVHELGHVFNLQHDETSPNFMRTSDQSTAYGAPAYLFTPHEQSRLEACSSDPNVMPGSSVFASDGAYNLSAQIAAPGPTNLQLKISVAKATFWRFEPTQLELQLGLPEDSAEIVSVPEILDPCHSRFRVMIENDLGERTLYRSTYATCGPDGSVRISPGGPYRRDIPIFGQRGGYTFRRAGKHRIWAVLDIPGASIRSNDLEVDVKLEVGLGAADREYRALLSMPRISTLLFHREDLDDWIGVRKLARYVEQTPRAPAASEINYTLARAMLKREAASLEGSVLLRERATRHLERALSLDDLGEFQRIRAEALLDELGCREPKSG